MTACRSSRAGRARALAICAAVLLTFVGLTPAARAAAPGVDQPAPTVDQSFTGGPNDLGAIINECCAFVAQTFTAGRTGVLTGVSVDVLGYGTSRLRVQIRTVTSEVPTETVLGETVLDSNGASLSQVITFPTPIAITAGVQYAIVLSYEGAPPAGAGQGQGSWSGGTGDQYAGGQLLAKGIVNPTGWFAYPTYDVHFVTYVLALPSTQEQCLDGGWRAFGVFKNQGDCVSFVAT